MKSFDKIKESAGYIRELITRTTNTNVRDIEDFIEPEDIPKSEVLQPKITCSTVNTSYKLQVKFANHSTNPNPEYATTGSSGFDLRANLGETLILKVGHRALIPTGLFFELPNNFEIQVRPRSGLAVKYGVTVLNSPGTVDADYRGEVKIILINHGEEDFVINHGDRVAQAVIATVSAKNILEFTQVDEVSTDTDRGTGGFNSTGIK